MFCSNYTRVFLKTLFEWTRDSLMSYNLPSLSSFIMWEVASFIMLVVLLFCLLAESCMAKVIQMQGWLGLRFLHEESFVALRAFNRLGLCLGSEKYVKCRWPIDIHFENFFFINLDRYSSVVHFGELMSSYDLLTGTTPSEKPDPLDFWFSILKLKMSWWRF